MQNRFYLALLTQNNVIETVLHDAARYHDSSLLWVGLEMYPEQGRLPALKQRNIFGDTVLHSAARNKNPDVLKALLEFYPKQDRLSALLEKDENGETVLHSAEKNKNPDVRKASLSCLSEAYRQAAEAILNPAAPTLSTSSVTMFGQVSSFDTSRAIANENPRLN